MEKSGFPGFRQVYSMEIFSYNMMKRINLTEKYVHCFITFFYTSLHIFTKIYGTEGSFKIRPAAKEPPCKSIHEVRQIEHKK